MARRSLWRELPTRTLVAWFGGVFIMVVLLGVALGAVMNPYA